MYVVDISESASVLVGACDEGKRENQAEERIERREGKKGEGEVCEKKVSLPYNNPKEKKKKEKLSAF